ncbi:MAG TPA: VOC family protein [Vicinamibacterales bacterium]|nr:VOC family protein [Vicinamibacterales bacterium]
MKKTTKKPAKKAARRTTRPARKASKQPAKRKKVAAVPKGYHTVTPHLVCRNAAGAIDFYKKAFGARVLARMQMPDGKVAHAELQIGDSRIMLGDEMPEMGASAPQTVGGTPVHLFLYVKNVDKLFARAVSAGARADMPPMNMFWGDRYGKVSDPFGHKWSMGTHIEDVSPREMARRSREAFNPAG